VGGFLGAVPFSRPAHAYRLRPRFRGARAAATFILWFASFGAVVTTIFGYLLSLTGDYGEELLSDHKFAGITVAVGTLLALVTKTMIDQKPNKLLQILYRGLLFVTTGALFFASHLGGTLTHGDVLTKKMPDPLKKVVGLPVAEVVSYDEALVYEHVISPVLEEKCWECHQESKKKGKFRMDSFELLMKGGKGGEPIIPGDDTDNSELVYRITTDDEDDRMPPEDPKMTPEEIALVKWWIKTGAPETAKISGLNPPDDIRKAAEQVLTSVRSKPAVADKAEKSETAEKKKLEAEAKASKIAADGDRVKTVSRALGVPLIRVSSDSGVYQFSAVNTADKFDDAELAKFAPVKDLISDLNLARTQVTDEGLAAVSGMSQLKRLRLENTKIGDAGLEHLSGVKSLEYLNLYGTRVTDKGLGALAGLSNLKKLYVWQTGVTREGAETVSKTIPGITVNLGDKGEVSMAPVAVAKTEPEKPVKPVALAYSGDLVAYHDVVERVMQEKCWSCHQESKKKGKFRMDSFELLMKGGRGGEPIVPGSLEDSELVYRITTDDEDDRMPPEDEPQMTKEEIALVQWWIQQGASETKKLSELEVTDEVKTMVTGVLASLPGKSMKKPAVSPEVVKTKEEIEANKKRVKKMMDAAREVSKELGVPLLPIAADLPQFSLNTVNVTNSFGDAELAKLSPIAGALVDVNLARTKISDKGLSAIAKMEKLEHLKLENTGITDAGLKYLEGLPSLEVLNLYGTKVTDVGLDQLATLKSLKKLFVWQTGVTREGAEKLVKKNANLVVNLGWDNQVPGPPPPAPVEKKQEPEKKAKLKADKKKVDKAPEKKKPADPAPASAKKKNPEPGKKVDKKPAKPTLSPPKKEGKDKTEGGSA